MTKKIAEGFDVLERQLVRLGAKVGGKALRISLRDSAKPMANKIQGRLPKDSGELAESVRVTSGVGNGKKHAARARVLVGGKKAPHAAKVEFGYEGKEPNPVIRNTFDEDAERTIDLIKDNLTDEIIKAVKKNGI